MKQESKRGGKRVGAGRKAGEGSTLVRIPNGCLQAVMDLVGAYRSGAVKPCQPVTEIKGQCVLNLVTEIKDTESMITDTEIKDTEQLKPVTEIKPESIQGDYPPIEEFYASQLPEGAKKVTSRKELERLPKTVQRSLEKQHGTLTNAVDYGLWILGKKVFDSPILNQLQKSNAPGRLHP